MKSVNDGFYNPGGVYDDFNELLINIEEKKNSKYKYSKKINREA